MGAIHALCTDSEVREKKVIQRFDQKREFAPSGGRHSNRQASAFFCFSVVWRHCTMYCLQWLIPVLLLPKPVNPALLYNHVMFIVLYLTGFFLEKKPCTICSLVFIVAMVLICYSGYDSCLFWSFCNHQDVDVDYTCEAPRQLDQ